MTADAAAELVAQTLARAARRAAIPALTKIAHQDATIAVEAIDGALFEITVSPVASILWPTRSNDHD